MSNHRRARRLLLINPIFPESFWSFRWALGEIVTGKAAVNPPLGLATLAALTPPSWHVQIVDENVEPVPLDPDVDLVGVCGMAVQFPRQRELLKYYRSCGLVVIAGGSYASLCPEEYAGLCDVVVAGEAEYLWPQVCRDLEHGQVRTVYQETGVVELNATPVPRFDLLKLDRYAQTSMQFSRGCPYQCEFCDIIVMFGRRPRTKTPEQIGAELDVLRGQGVRSVFFVDDNLIGNRPRAKALLSYLADYQRRHDYRFEFGTEASINLAEDARLMALFREANFAWTFIGIESPDPASLKEANKSQNLRSDLLSSVRTLYKNGIDVLGGFIIGFDNDSLETFDLQYRFVVDSGIQVAMIGLLTALPKTPLHDRLEREGRLIGSAAAADNTKAATNILPVRMSYDEMIRGYTRLHRRLTRDAAIAERIRNKMRYLRRPVAQNSYSFAQASGIVLRFIRRGLAPGGPVRWYHFTRSLLSSPPRTWALVLSDWIAGLSLRDYVDRHFDSEPVSEPTRRALDSMRRVLARALRSGTLTLDLEPVEVELTITISRVIDRRVVRRLGRHLDKLLARSATRVRLRIDELSAPHVARLDGLLSRLSRYGDRITLSLHETLRPLISVDTSRFRCVLDGG
jgi:radical SAM superfamily enzyme YgiQ (UPF0313 family)